MLLWVLILSLFGAAVAVFGRNLPDRLLLGLHRADMRRVDCICRCGHQQHVTVCGRINDVVSGDRATSACTIFNGKLLPEAFRQSLPYETRNDVGPAAGGKADDDAYWPCWIIERPRRARYGGQYGTRHQLEKSSAGKCHGDAPRT